VHKYANYLSPEEFSAAVRHRPRADVAKVQSALRKLGFAIDYTARPAACLCRRAARLHRSNTTFGREPGSVCLQRQGPARQCRDSAATGFHRRDSLVRGRSRRYRRAAQAQPISAWECTSQPSRIAGDEALARCSALHQQEGINSPVCSDYWGDHTANIVHGSEALFKGRCRG